MKLKKSIHSAILIAIPLAIIPTAHAATLLWSDGFNQADSLNIRDLTLTRQTFATGSNLTNPIGFLTNAVAKII